MENNFNFPLAPQNKNNNDMNNNNKMEKWALFAIHQKLWILHVTYAYNNVLVSWAIIKECLRGFSSKSKPSRVVFGIRPTRDFKKYPVDPHYHDNRRNGQFLQVTKNNAFNNVLLN